MASQEITAHRDNWFQQALKLNAELPSKMCQFLLRPVGLLSSANGSIQEEEFLNQILRGLEPDSSDFLRRFMADPLVKTELELKEINPTLVMKANPLTAKEAPCLFLDRDGTIIELIPYVKDPSLICLRPGIVDRIREARGMGWWVICVTNQSGVGRGFYTWDEYQGIQSRMDDLLAKEGVYLDHSFAAGYFPQSEFAIGHFFPELRKPATGMIDAACKHWPIDVASSVMIGDSEVDRDLATNAGVGTYLSVKEVAPVDPSIWLARFRNS